MIHRKYYMYTPGRSSQPAGMNCILILIIINVLTFILVPRLRFGELALSSYGIQRLKLWQFVTYLFLHGDILHIALNMWCLYLFGKYVLTRLDTRQFLTLYFLSGISGAVLWLLFNWGSVVPVIGASGAVFGVMMAAAMFYPNKQIMLIFPPIPMTLKTFVAIFAVIEILSEFSNSQGGVAHLAHLGGFLSAYVYIRTLSGESIWDIIKSPLRGFRLFSQPRQRNTNSPTKQSEVNRKTFESIMAEIEEIEKTQKRKQDDDSTNR